MSAPVINVLLSLYDLTGNASRPYHEAGWIVYQVDIQNGCDILEWDYTLPVREHGARLRVGIIAMQPCTCYALCGNRSKKKRDTVGLWGSEFDHHQKLVSRTKEIIEWYRENTELVFWMLENPMTDIHKKNPWLGGIVQKFNPCDFAGYDPVPENSRYNKMTWLFGEFQQMIPRPLSAKQKEFPGHRLGGKSLKVKNARSVTPLGFAYAFFESNH